MYIMREHFLITIIIPPKPRSCWGVYLYSYLWRAMNSGTGITGQLWQPTTSLHTWPIVPFHKSQDTLLHPGLNDQTQNTFFTEDPHGHFGVGLIDCQAQRAPTLIGQHWSTISASTRYLGLNPLWLVTHCTLSHAHHSFQSHMYHLVCMEMAKFLCAIFNWLKLFYCYGVTSPKPLS